MIAVFSDMPAVDAVTLFFSSERSSDPTEDGDFGSLERFTHLGGVITDVHEMCWNVRNASLESVTVI